ncbi:MAG TPA: UDP-N-acetylmuramoyl-L-alanine--D-glutamate ligase [Rectinemataceae bacterium]|nr:UDP-N-acetylmuramoyl-L-alanine--D-glutamate ligase [Rectinemataceae bacterium]
MPFRTLRRSDLRGLRVTVMGLGLHGGGIATARFLAMAGAELTVTDMKGEEDLADSVAALEGLPIRFVLGRHDIEDFSSADIVVKNPAVRPDSPYVLAAKAIETDVSLFLRFCESPILAVTGSKGKSTVATALHHGLVVAGKKAFLGGNITVSPLAFLDETSPDSPVVLELSSWQLADMRGQGVLKPKIAVLTSIMPDHMNRYSSMEEYVADKRLIYADQDGDCYTVLNRDDLWSPLFAAETKARVAWYAESRESARGGEETQDGIASEALAWLEDRTEAVRRGRRGRCILPRSDSSGGDDDSATRIEDILPERLLVPGGHQRKNLLGAALALRLFGIEAGAIREAMGSFTGVEHRLEPFVEKDGIVWYNDSAATIPQAVAAALESFDDPLILITGGTDKNLDFEPVHGVYARAKAIILLAGTGTDKLISWLDRDGTPYLGPFDDLETAVRTAAALAVEGDRVLLSPGCASFGMFLHEFDRGRKFKETVRRLLG